MIFELIASIFTPAAKLIDELVTSDEERLKLRNELAKIERDVKLKTIDLETEIVKARTSVIVAESASQSWITRSWRPICALLLVGYVTVGPLIGYPPPSDVYAILQVFLSVYAGGRSLEMASKHLNKR